MTKSSELKVDVKQLLKDWNDCPEDDGFTEGHPIFLMAQEVDAFRDRLEQLQSENKAVKQQLFRVKEAAKVLKTDDDCDAVLERVNRALNLGVLK